MIVNPNSKTLLCYGDSNTWGQMSDNKGRRYPIDVRWTGILQSRLGDEYYVIEEGLSSRTTDLDYAAKPGRNGRTYLEPCLDSHTPIDHVILMLGTNDFKIEFNRSAEDIAQAVHGLVELIMTKTARYDDTPAEVTIVSPILIDGDATMYQEWYGGRYDETSVQKSRELAGWLAKVAQNTGSHFVDAATVAKAGRDGIHFDEESHQALGDFLARHIRNFV